MNIANISVSALGLYKQTQPMVNVAKGTTSANSNTSPDIITIDGQVRTPDLYTRPAPCCPNPSQLSNGATGCLIDDATGQMYGSRSLTAEEVAQISSGGPSTDPYAIRLEFTLRLDYTLSTEERKQIHEATERAGAPYVFTASRYCGDSLVSIITQTYEPGKGWSYKNTEFLPEGEEEAFRWDTDRFTYKATVSVGEKVLADFEGEDLPWKWNMSTGKWDTYPCQYSTGRENHGQAYHKTDSIVDTNSSPLNVSPADQAADRAAMQEMEGLTQDIRATLGNFFGKMMGFESPFALMFGLNGLLSLGNAGALSFTESQGIKQMLEDVNRYLAAEEAGEDTEGMLSPELTGIGEKFVALKEVMGKIHDKSLLPKDGLRFGIAGKA